LMHSLQTLTAVGPSFSRSGLHGGFVTKSKKKGKRMQLDKKTPKRNRNKDTVSGQTNQPFERDLKRRIGHYGGAGDPTLMKK
jgi:hypothetical protein